MNFDLRTSPDDSSQRMLNAIEPGIVIVVDACHAQKIPIGQWHTVKALESGTVILECKDGPYEPLGEDEVLEKKK